MGQDFPETAHLKTNQKNYNEGWERIFGKKQKEPCLACIIGEDSEGKSPPHTCEVRLENN